MHEHENDGRIQLGSEVELRSEMELETPHELPAGSDEEEVPSTEQQVKEALQNLSSTRDIQVQVRPCDKTEDEVVAQFASAGCGCSKKCSSQFSLDYIRDMRSQCYDLTHTELNMVLLGQLVASTNTSGKVVVESGHLGKERQRVYTIFYHAGKVVCGKKNVPFSTHNREQEA